VHRFIKATLVACLDGLYHRRGDHRQSSPANQAHDPGDRDESVGRLLARLEKNGLANRTGVIFASDNGGLPAARRSDCGTAVRRRSLTGKGRARGASLFH